ncbi:hypothetical protein SAMN05428642_102449 [Flaviramulus basaltis]|uniref:SpoIIAA-like n=1 Tax=Flaviramulus basaltis TaxID=369401 RepID=A0A1K2IJW3_9FLAO|nr:hypothetical protein [Flaviramulus basaltis]SFZ91955.1 hypothetical protein SAMN05428642_102449 [Flaviramulus basaltis]
MQFENSSLSKKYTYSLKKFGFGKLFFLEKIIVAEMNYGIHFDWDKTEIITNSILQHYGKNCKVGYISNRINSYSFEPDIWSKFFEKYNFVVASASVYYSKMTLMNATIEKQFSKRKIKITSSLEDAFDWILSLKELS